MADTFEVKCIDKSDRLNPSERIQNIGGFDNGQAWKISQDTAIQGMESGKWRFYVSVGSHSVWIVVAVHDGRKYLKPQADGYSIDNLLGLPECN